MMPKLMRVINPLSVSPWSNADTYCTWAEAQLPTEAQWEYAARGPENHIYPWGDTPEPNENLLNFNRHVGKTTPVGSYPEGASWNGALDLAGNASEWTDGIYEAYPGNDKPSPFYLQNNRIGRGGSWNNFLEEVNTFSRYNGPDGVIQRHIGFRCAFLIP